MADYSETTENITVTVEPFYLDEQSEPSDDHYLWAYRVVISNNGSEVVQLLNRHWKITDAGGRVEEVRGPGVIGEQPVLSPGESFEYTSGCPLSTPSGFMVGTYEMKRENGDLFDIAIPAFSLDSPHSRPVIH
ncbi:MAG: Co2+/Mg2+ efflux protein ApaG [Rhodospirillales bacterium]